MRLAAAVAVAALLLAGPALAAGLAPVWFQETVQTTSVNGQIRISGTDQATHVLFQERDSSAGFSRAVLSSRTTAGWESIQFESPTRGGGLAIGFDGSPHFVLLGNHMDPFVDYVHGLPAYTREHVYTSSSPFVLGAALALGPNGDPHIVTVADGVVRHAFRQGATWMVEQIDAGANSVGGLAVAVDAMGRVHVAFGDSSVTNLKYAVRDTNGAWSVETRPECTSQVDLALSATGTAHVACRRSDTFRYLQRSEGVWVGEDVADWDFTREIAIAVDANDRPHIVATTWGGSENRLDPSQPHYFTKNDGVWTREVIDATAHSTGHGADIWLRADGVPVVAYVVALRSRDVFFLAPEVPIVNPKSDLVVATPVEGLLPP